MTVYLSTRLKAALAKKAEAAGLALSPYVVALIEADVGEDMDRPEVITREHVARALMAAARQRGADVVREALSVASLGERLSDISDDDMARAYGLLSALAAGHD